MLNNNKEENSIFVFVKSVLVLNGESYQDGTAFLKCLFAVFIQFIFLEMFWFFLFNLLFILRKVLNMCMASQSIQNCSSKSKEPKITVVSFTIG